MNLLDENFPEDQWTPLKEWRIPFRQIGRHVAHLGIKDPEIVPLLHRLRRATFFTQDFDFFKPALCHASYCVVLLNVPADDAALYVRRFLKHPCFNTFGKRAGIVARAHHDGIHFWRRNQASLQRVGWIKK